MAKRFKLKLSLPSFQLCRSKQPIYFSQNPSPAATYMFSPINPKAIDIAFPYSPGPPPSTPNHPSFKSEENNSNSNPRRKIYNSYLSDDSEKPEKKNRKKGKASVRSNTSLESGWCSSDEETESLLSSSFDSSYDFENISTLETIDERSVNGSRRRMKNKKKNLELQRLRSGRVWKNCRGIEEVNLGEGKVSESFAVVKRSEDPYEDFKRSMLEMILEKQMFEAKDLEQLLRCFLSLNSRNHHSAIVEAFSEIWELLFGKYP